MDTSTSSVSMVRNRIFKMHEEASSLFKQGDFEQALTKFNQAISEGANMVRLHSPSEASHDDMVLKVVNAALRQREKCQFRLLKM